MPTLWLVREGEDSTRGRGQSMTFEAVSSIFKKYQFHFLAARGPKIHPTRQSWGPEHVVLEIGAEETDAVVTFGRNGFYIVEGLKPGAAIALLDAYNHPHESLR